ncbi:MAG: hypothetical protein U5N21_14585 [Rhodococcus sp. (in: high G+C Gram-positive bacteria)]|nr:hypothetical protein [Rhodococcus sp. (in: high G+C Gram-positive bacteria)]
MSGTGRLLALVGRVLEMERSRIEHALSKAVVNTEAPPSDLALDAIVAGVRVEDTRPPAADVDMVWPAEPTSL